MPGAKVEIVQNGSPSQQHSLLLDNEHAVAIARFLRVDPALCLDFCSNVTGIDWLDRTVKKSTKVKKLVDGQEKEIVETTEEKIPGYLEAVYHLYSITLKQGPVVIRMRTGDRAEDAPSALAHPSLAQRGISGTRDFRSLRDSFRWSPGSAADFDVGRVRRSSDAQRLCAAGRF